MVELLLMWVLAPREIQARLHWDLCCRRAWKQERGALSSLLEGRRAGSLRGITAGVGLGLLSRRSALGVCLFTRWFCEPCLCVALQKQQAFVAFWILLFVRTQLCMSEAIFQFHIVSLYFVTGGGVCPGTSTAAKGPRSQTISESAVSGSYTASLSIFPQGWRPCSQPNPFEDFPSWYLNPKLCFNFFFITLLPLHIPWTCS